MICWMRLNIRIEGKKWGSIIALTVLIPDEAVLYGTDKEAKIEQKKCSKLTMWSYARDTATNFKMDGLAGEHQS